MGLSKRWISPFVSKKHIAARRGEAIHPCTAILQVFCFHPGTLEWQDVGCVNTPPKRMIISALPYLC